MKDHVTLWFPWVRIHLSWNVHPGNSGSPLSYHSYCILFLRFFTTVLSWIMTSRRPCEQKPKIYILILLHILDLQLLQGIWKDVLFSEYLSMAHWWIQSLASPQSISRGPDEPWWPMHRHTHRHCTIMFLAFFHNIWVVVSNIFCFHPYLGKIPILTNIFQRGWHHQPEISCHILSFERWCFCVFGWHLGSPSACIKILADACWGHASTTVTREGKSQRQAGFQHVYTMFYILRVYYTCTIYILYGQLLKCIGNYTSAYSEVYWTWSLNMII